jgi:hypothetical protein
VAMELASVLWLLDIIKAEKYGNCVCLKALLVLFYFFNFFNAILQTRLIITILGKVEFGCSFL